MSYDKQRGIADRNVFVVCVVTGKLYSGMFY